MARVARAVSRAALVRRSPALIGPDALAREAGVHPEIVRRFVRLGLLEPRGGTDDAPLFGAQDAYLLARAMRLRRDLGVNYAGAVLASELLTRIEQLEQQLRAGEATLSEREVIAWIRR
jgi:DNA-binding transcriptional MerR regulator